MTYVTKTRSRNMVIAALAIPVVLTLSVSSALAATVNTRSNVVFIVDESGSMSGEQAFLENTVIDKLDTDLLAAGVSDERRYGVVGFGGSVSSNDPRQIGGALLQNSGLRRECPLPY